MHKKPLLGFLSACLALTCSFSPNIAQGANFEPPSSCVYGRDRTSWTLDVSQVEIEARYNETDEQQEQDKKDLLENIIKILEVSINSLDYIRIETPNYVLQGEEFRAKGNLFDRFAYTRFHNSEFGYIGKDKSNWDGNSYLHMKFQNTYGLGLIWITRSDQSECSMEPVYVQKRPTILSASADTGYGRIDVDLSFALDQYSQAVNDAAVNTRVTISARNGLYGNTQSETFTTSTTSGNRTFTLYPDTGGGSYIVTVTVSDGNFSTSHSLGDVVVPGQSFPPCPTCQPL